MTAIKILSNSRQHFWFICKKFSSLKLRKYILSSIVNTSEYKTELVFRKLHQIDIFGI